MRRKEEEVNKEMTKKEEISRGRKLRREEIEKRANKK